MSIIPNIAIPTYWIAQRSKAVVDQRYNRAQGNRVRVQNRRRRQHMPQTPEVLSKARFADFLDLLWNPP
ncbi:hypothetical protein, partial [Paraburkholderia strydomiana]|uniref:hypothetical protein n=1 Tax=Paraburkholderia strydomiana TaxID=1245417 RepID=UPI0038BA2270